MSEIIIRIKIAEGRRDEVPSSIPRRSGELLGAAFEELVDEGIIDIIVADPTP